MLSPRAKIHPTATEIIKSEDFQQNVEIVSLSMKNKPFKSRSIDITSLKKGVKSGSISSFLSNASSSAVSSIETLINYLSTHLNSIMTDKTYLKKFEDLSVEVFTFSHDTELQRIMKSHGWSGSRYRGTDDQPFDAQSLLQALSNLYLKNKVSNYTQHISNMFGLGDEKGADQILSFCPDMLLTFLKRTTLHVNDDDESDVEGVRCFHFKGACMLADISGFSKFSAAMCQQGVSGLDELRAATNGFLGHIVQLVYKYQGDVIAFAGDALICVFLDENADKLSYEPGQSETDLHSASNSTEDEDLNPNEGMGSYRAVQCAVEMRDFKTDHFSAHVGVSFGDMKIAFLGGLHDQWVYLLNGNCVSELAGCINDAGPQEVVITKSCYEKALRASRHVADAMAIKKRAQRGSKFPEDQTDSEDMLQGVSGITVVTNTDDEEKTESAGYTPIQSRPCPNSNNLLIEDIAGRTVTDDPQRRKSGRKMSMMMRKQTSRIINVNSHEETHGLIEKAALFVPRPVLAAVYSESLEHIGELRQVTTMFLSLDSYSATKHEDPASLQPFFAMAQQALFEAGGFLRQFLVDDKGCVFIAMWGMPSFTYANNCSRALYCAATIRNKSPNLNHKVSIGITTGNVFCGSVGAPERRDYAGIGSEVNLAARFMSKAKGRILLDKATYNNLNQNTKSLLGPAESMKLKGMTDPVTPYQYNSDELPKMSLLDENQGYSTILRRHVKNIISTQMDKISNKINNTSKESYFTIVMGSPGTGKSTAAEYFRHGMRKRNIPCILIQARPGHEGVPYGVIRELILELIGEENFIEEGQQRERITFLIEQAFPDSEEPEKQCAQSYLEAVLGVEWSNNHLMHSFSNDDAFGGNTPTTPSHRKSIVPSSYKGNSPSNDLRKSVLQQQMQTYVQIHESTGSNGSNSSGTPNDSFQHILNEENDPFARALLRPADDQTVYKVLATLLKSERTAIIIEDAHFCDELSWNELLLLLTGKEINCSVLLTLRSSGGSNPVNAAANNGVSHVGNVSTPNGQRKSVLISQHDVESLRTNASNSVHMRDNANNISNSLNNKENALSHRDSNGGESRYGTKLQSSPAYLSILGHEHSTVVEMSNLSELEVQEILLHTLQVDSVSNSLVKLVLDVSSGNAFWCKAIAHFIKERGAEELERQASHDSSGNNVQTLKQLILLRMEKLTVDHQIILKHAAIIGEEFSDKMLRAVLPEKLRLLVNEAMEVIVEHGFVVCIAEYPQLVFSFQNDLIRHTLAELTPPRDAAHTHLAIAMFIEEEYSKNLRPFYPILCHHYKRSHEKRQLAFKYAVKAADQAISRGAFSDGLRFVEIASGICTNEAECTVLLSVINRAIRDMQPTIMPIAMTNKRRNTVATPANTPSSAQNSNKNNMMANNNLSSRRQAAYNQLKNKTELQLETHKKNKQLRLEQEQRNTTNANNNKSLLNRLPSARLNWQPSYVASRMNDESEEDSSIQLPVNSKGSIVGNKSFFGTTAANSSAANSKNNSRQSRASSSSSRSDKSNSLCAIS